MKELVVHRRDQEDPAEREMGLAEERAQVSYTDENPAEREQRLAEERVIITNVCNNHFYNKCLYLKLH